MRLWTWQKKDFSLTEGKVESLEHSDYLNHPCIPECEKALFREAYKKLRERLGTGQFLWCFANEEEAKNNPSKLEYEGKVLWEIEVPDNSIFRIVCNTAWNIIIGTGPSSEKYRLVENFDDWWRAITFDETWNMLFVDKGKLKHSLLREMIKGCTQVIIRHPVEKEWVKGSWPWKDVYS
ncbi:MAG TPA: hypothetical protein HPP87_01525 [Planctomycetes bacterium]|nr:hypothetical protein [Planctomycetota bacterium]